MTSEGEKWFLGLVLVAAILALMALIYLLQYHIYFVWNNLTTIEDSSLEEFNPFHLGPRKKPVERESFGKFCITSYCQGTWLNFKQRMGREWWKWLLPLQNQIGDGTVWEVNLP